MLDGRLGVERHRTTSPTELVRLVRAFRDADARRSLRPGASGFDRARMLIKLVPTISRIFLSAPTSPRTFRTGLALLSGPVVVPRCLRRHCL
jgi:hypothetical protein